jgi:tungstate transport system permease protein
MVIAQTVIALPLVAGFSAAALQHVDPDFRVQMAGLGAGRLRSGRSWSKHDSRSSPQ